jgi:hypothetical protein
MDGLSKSVEDIEFPYNKGLILAVSLVFFLKTEKMPAGSLADRVDSQAGEAAEGSQRGWKRNSNGLFRELVGSR